MRTITPALEALLRSRFQAAGSGYAARFEVDTPVAAGGAPALQQSASAANTTHYTVTLPSSVTPGNRLVLLMTQTTSGGSAMDTPAGWTLEVSLEIAVFKFNARRLFLFTRVADESDTDTWAVSTSGIPGVANSAYWLGEYSPSTVDGAFSAAAPTDSYSTNTITLTPSAAGEPVAVVVGGQSLSGNVPSVAGITVTGDLPEIVEVSVANEGRFAVAALEAETAAASYSSTFTGTGQFSPGTFDRTFMVGIILTGAPATAVTTTYNPKRAGVNRNLRMGPDQLEVELANETGGLGFGPTSIFPTNSRCRLYQWFGDPDNEVLTFTGVIDKVNDSRDPLTTTLTCRSLAGPILVDQTFSTIGPQEADNEEDEVRTAENGVYEDLEVSDIALDILERAGWPADSIDVADTSFVLDSFLREDGESGWDSLARLAGFVGYALWDDEDGIIHFRPLGDDAGIDEPLTADYEYLIGAGL